MSEIRNEMYLQLHGYKPIKRARPKEGESKWYYLDPRGTDNVSEMKTIDVSSQYVPNPKIIEIVKDDMKRHEEDYYIWRTEGDDKVRDAHAAREGKVYNWNLPPVGGNPGEDYNCRCWAEPYKPHEDEVKKGEIVELTGENEIYLVGSLSQEFESNQNPGAIGYDNAGGYSYGLYQIATIPGTMKDYLIYLENSDYLKYRKYAEVLNKAGGYEAALHKTKNFENAWKQLAKESEFASSQSEFIGKNRYERILNRIQDIKGLNLEQRHPVISDVIRSMAVQHGQAQIPIHRALGKNSDISTWSDTEIINALYNARTDYMAQIKYESPSDRQKQLNIINYRYPKERQKALDALKKNYN